MNNQHTLLLTLNRDGGQFAASVRAAPLDGVAYKASATGAAHAVSAAGIDVASLVSEPSLTSDVVEGVGE